MKNRLFNKVQIRKPKSNLFDLSHEKKLSMNMGDLVPIYLEEVVPGDKFRVSTESLIRLAPMLAPVMHRVNAYVHYFFVPNRLLYNSWENFITGGEDGLQVPAFPMVYISESTKSNFTKGSLADYMGIPPVEGSVTGQININALPFRAYQLIYNEYYRDQNLIAKVPVTKNDTVSGAELNDILTMRKRAWEKDYFTSALPWAQRGGEVNLSMNPVIEYKMPAEAWYPTEGTPSADGNLITSSGAIGVTGQAGVMIDNIESLESQFSINELRRATRLQEWLEKNARAGSRYIEQILSHFGVTSSDARLQRPEYLGGGKQPIVISEVLATFNGAETDGGQMYGHGISVGNTNKFSRFFEEHGYVIGIMSVLPRTAYQNGIEKMWTKFDKFEYYWPEFANLGEQEVKNSELFIDYANSSARGLTFGYQPRYAEMKFKQSTVHGEFRDTLDYWHMGRKFTSQPALNGTFVTADPTHRIFPVVDPAEQKLYVQLYNDVKAIRPMPIFGTPTL